MLLCLSVPTVAGAQAFTPMTPRQPTSGRLEELRRQLRGAQAVGAASVFANDVRDAARDQVLTLQDQIATEEEKAAKKGKDFMRQGGFNFGDDSGSVTLQAADLFLSRDFRFFLRSTVPIETDEEKEGEEAEEGGSEPSIDDAIKSALTDPYGGTFYATLGWLPRVIPWPFGGNAGDGTLKPWYGAFADVRAGIRAVNIPGTEEGDERRIAPFYTVSIGPRLQLPMFGDQEGKVQAGDLGLAMLWVGNWVADDGVSTLFSGPTPTLRTGSHHWTLSAAVLLGENAYISLEGTTSISESELGRRWVLGLHLLGDAD